MKPVSIKLPLTDHCRCGLQEYKRKQLEEQRQSERLQRQLQQEHAYLVSLQQQQDKKPQLYHYNKNLEPNNKPAWAREVPAPTHTRTRTHTHEHHPHSARPRAESSHASPQAPVCPCCP